MFQKTSQSFYTKHLFTTSFFGLLLTGMLTVYPPRLHEHLFWRKPLIGSIFGVVCFLGILAVFYSRWCSRIFQLEKERSNPFHLGKVASHRTSSTLQGHHPDCGHFSGHVFQIGDKKFCAACIGLFLGGLSAFAGSLLYFFANWSVEQNNSLVIWLGILGVGFGLFQFKFRSFIRLFFNISFVLGTLLILVGVDKLVQSVTVDLFLVALTLFWLYTRIVLSQWDHERICSACKIVNCKFDGKKEGIG